MEGLAVAESKRCNLCGESKPLSAFSRDRKQFDELNPTCRICQSTTNQERRRCRNPAFCRGVPAAMSPGLIAPGEEVLDDAGRDWSWAFVLYREVAGWPGYLVGINQTFWSNHRRPICSPGWDQMRTVKQADGYLTVKLYRDGKSRLLKAHVLIMEAFLGPQPAGMNVCHFPNPDRGNNRLSNLRWGTPRENASHKELQGTSQKGSRSGAAKLTEADVMEIRRIFESGEARNKRAIAARYGVTPTAIGFIINRKNWTHI
jgi:hypothetical protein